MVIVAMTASYFEKLLRECHFIRDIGNERIRFRNSVTSRQRASRSFGIRLLDGAHDRIPKPTAQAYTLRPVALEDMEFRPTGVVCRMNVSGRDRHAKFPISRNGKTTSDPHPRAAEATERSPSGTQTSRKSRSPLSKRMANGGYKSGRCLMDRTSIVKVTVNYNASQSPSTSIHRVLWQGENRCPSSLFPSYRPGNCFRVRKQLVQSQVLAFSWDSRRPFGVHG